MGCDRQGNDLFGNSVVALDADTGKMKWYFQAVHHDIWDMRSAARAGADGRDRQREEDADSGADRQVGYMYILDRVTGKPVFGVEEKPVPQSNVPGEQTSPTQPIPVKPPALARQSVSIRQDMVTAADTNEEHAKACQDLVAQSGRADQ